jgi:hypothetical protein
MDLGRSGGHCSRSSRLLVLFKKEKIKIKYAIIESQQPTKVGFLFFFFKMETKKLYF